jgi:hypothetical protein
MSPSGFLNCPLCIQRLGSDPGLAGRRVRCPACRGQFQIPKVAVPQPFAFEEHGPIISQRPSRRRREPNTAAVLLAIGLLTVIAVGGILVATGVVRFGQPGLDEEKAARDLKQKQGTEGQGGSANTQMDQGTKGRDTPDQGRTEQPRGQQELERATRREEAERERRRREEATRLETDRQERRQKIRAELNALPEKERRESETLLNHIRQYAKYADEVERHLQQLQSVIADLQLEVQLGRAFGTPRAPAGAVTKEQVLMERTQEYKKYLAELQK